MIDIHSNKKYFRISRSNNDDTQLPTNIGLSLLEYKYITVSNVLTRLYLTLL